MISIEIFRRSRSLEFPFVKCHFQLVPLDEEYLSFQEMHVTKNSVSYFNVFFSFSWPRLIMSIFYFTGTCPPWNPCILRSLTVHSLLFSREFFPEAYYCIRNLSEKKTWIFFYSRTESKLKTCILSALFWWK